MLHHNYGIAEVAQRLQRVDEAAVIALMQSDAGLVQNVEHVHELASYLRGKTYALAFSARQAHRGTRKGKIVQSHIQEKTQAGADFLHNLSGNAKLARSKFSVKVLQPFVQFAQVHCRQLGNVLSGNAEVEGLLVQALSVTMRTLCGAAEGIGPFLRSGAHVRVLHLPYIFYQPFIVSIEIVAGLCGFGRNAQTLRRTVQNLVQQLVIHFLKRGIKRETITFNERLYLPEYHRLTRFPQRGYSSLAHR